MSIDKRYIIKSEQVMWSEDSFHQTYDRFYQALVMYALNYISDQAMAEDIVQDVFSQIWEIRRSLRVFPPFGCISIMLSGTMFLISNGNRKQPVNILG